jgi:putative FmdB family regulatory protein
MPTYEHACSNCNHEWEDTYSIKQDPPIVCPNCKEEGNVKRLISMPAGVTVELTGRELVTKLWKEGKDLARQARKDENLAHNLYGNK